MSRYLVIVCALAVACGEGSKNGEDSSTDTGADIADTAEEEATLPDYCEADEICNDDDPCNGEETCDTDTNTCHWGSALDDGFVCQPSPRRICVRGRCRESECGDGYVDRGGGEFCEMSLDEECLEGCTYMCMETSECLDEDVCNGSERCDTEAHLCRAGVPVSNGTICDNPPRQICLYGVCTESICNDGYIDVIGGEECEGRVEQDCTTECGVDGVEVCNWLCRWSECEGPAPANDQCADATSADGGGTFEGTTCSAVNDFSFIPTCMEDWAPDVFYSLSLSAAADVEINTCTGTEFDTVLAVFQGTCDDATEVACQDDLFGCGDGTQSSISTHLDAGDYLIVVDGKEIDTDEFTEGDFTLTVNIL